jgi:hypothetical protein
MTDNFFWADRIELILAEHRVPYRVSLQNRGALHYALVDGLIPHDLIYELAMALGRTDQNVTIQDQAGQSVICFK